MCSINPYSLQELKDNFKREIDNIWQQRGQDITRLQAMNQGSIPNRSNAKTGLIAYPAYCSVGHGESFFVGGRGCSGKVALAWSWILTEVKNDKAILSSLSLLFLEWLGKSIFFYGKGVAPFLCVCQEIFSEGVWPA